MTGVLAIDPGPVRSGWAELDADGQVLSAGVEDNAATLDRLRAAEKPVALEWITSYGMAVGATTFETCYWVGRFAQAAGDDVTRIPRREVKLELCGSSRAKDPNVRQVLIDRYGGIEGRAKAIGRKASPGPLYGVASHAWAALAVGVVYLDRCAGG